MCNEKPKPCAAELRALYDIRVKEVHHYNTVIWAFPIAFAALVAAEVNYLGVHRVALIVASLFNGALWYIFCNHLQHKECILETIRFTESELAELYGRRYVPDFSLITIARGLPRPTTVANWAIGIVTVMLFIAAVAGVSFPKV